MNEQTSTSSVVRRSSEELIRLVRLYESGQPRETVKNFCSRHQITEGAFNSAKRRYGHKAVGKSGFTAVQPPAPPAAGSALFARVGEISLYQPVPPAYLKALLS